MIFNIFFSILAGLLMDVPVQAVLFLGIIPALALLYISLKGYEGYYRDKTIFLTFVIGIIFGVIAAVMRLLIHPPPLMIIYIVLFAFFEQLFKTIVLNIGRLQGKKETTIYGLSLGLGFGSSFTPFLIIAGSSVGLSDIYYMSLIVVGSLGFISFHAATGAYIGYGIYSRKMTKYLLIAILLQLPFNAIADATRFYLNPYFPYFQLGLIVYGAIFFWYVVTKVIPRILEQSDIRKRSKKQDKTK
jgi:hypothetical protein